MDILPSSQKHEPSVDGPSVEGPSVEGTTVDGTSVDGTSVDGLSGDESDSCQFTPKPTPIPTAKTRSVMTSIIKARGCSLIAARKLNREQRQSHLVNLDLVEICFID